MPSTLNEFLEKALKDNLNEKEGMMLPYLKKMLKQLSSTEKFMRSSMQLKHNNVVSQQEINLMNQIKDKVALLQKLLDEGPDFS